MIDTSVGSTCKFCGKPVEQVPGRRKREFCNDACRQRHHRVKKQPLREQDQAPQGNTYTEMLSELRELRAKVADQAHMITELEDYNQRLKSLLSIGQNREKDQQKEITHLKALLDIERRHHDNQPRPFRGWLRKQEPTDLIKRLLALGDRLPLKANRAYYLAMVRSLQGPETDGAEFEDLWKLMLLSQE